MKTKQQLIERVTQLEKQLNQEVMNNRGYNEYKFLEELEQGIKDRIESKDINNTGDIQEYIESQVYNECIYYNDCFKIAIELNATDFTAFDMGEINNISQLAYAALEEYVREELNISELEGLIIVRNNKEVL